MQTRFSPEQRADPVIREADRILRKCVHCGFCLATCPTYLETGDERDSPRGRIWLINDLLEESTPDAAKASTTQHHLDRCLTCLSCMTTCPSGVDYQHLVEIGRTRALEAAPRGYGDRLMRRFLVISLSNAGLFRWLVFLAWVSRIVIAPLKLFLQRIKKAARLVALLDAVPQNFPRLDSVGKRDAVYPPVGGEKRYRVALLQGCAQRVLDPGINAATIRLLNRHHVEVVVKSAVRCCGAVAAHTTGADSAQGMMISTITALAKEHQNEKLDAIIINASGCGAMVKDYGHLFAQNHSPQNLDFSKAAALVSSLAVDITEFLVRIGLENPRLEVSREVKVAYHAACSLQHGQAVRSAPKDLLAAAGFEVVEGAESHLCCGAAGSYHVLEPELSTKLKTRKLTALEAAGADVIASANIGCIHQLGQATAPVVHTVQLLDWATGGVKPEKLRGS